MYITGIPQRHFKMVFFEAVQALLQLDVGFFIGLALSNIFWVFAFYLMIHYFFEGKKTVYFFFLWGFLLWAILDWEHITGFAFSGAAVLMLYYVTKIALLKFAETTPALKKYMIVLSTIQAYGLIWVFTFFLKGGG